MPRGRHRNPEPLHRLLTPSAVAGVSVTTAVAAWLPAETLTLRLLVAVTAAAGITGAVLMRSWDRAAGRRVSELARDRVKDEWRTEERIAELESDLEEARVLRAKLDAKLRAKRVELAGLRSEHAALLRRYATAETERASALEGRRLLAIEAASPSSSAPRELPPVSEERTAAGAPTPVGYARANAALAALARRGDRPSAAPARRLAATVAPYTPPRRSAARVEGGFDFFGTQAAAGTAASQARAAIEAVQHEDLADVVGEEALAAHKAESTARATRAGRAALPAVPAAPAVPAPAGDSAPEAADAAAGEAGEAGEAGDAGQVIDLTAHDETEPIDVARLRTAIS
ncbi:hypothetical protein DEJ50_18185 [Streptomyces venezuelae]|uniref:Secreted protein n=1 Tax=Streptomyces venezuelae TaxID=54571 RepID=A0A5P2D2S0_STRVZ|nr:hypothetical protein [Streptomyces venezuelae]QES49452.1 hypothetical protein DEJ50_18185 [Streptomyces venezuelae]